MSTIDERGWQQWSRSNYRTARKTHVCGECRRVIMPGERYQTASGMTDDSIWSAKVCVHCEVAADWLATNCRGYLYHAIIDDFREHAEGNMPMLRIVVGANRQWKSFTDPTALLPIPAYPPDMP